MALTENGYHRPTYNEILDTKIQKAKDLFGEDIDTSEQTALGKFIRIGAYDLSKAYEDIEYIYYSRFPNSASGLSLDRLCVFAGITRNPATLAEHTITVLGNADTQVNEIIVCGEDDTITFHNIEPFTIPESGNIDIVVQCDTEGTKGNVTEINEIVNPIAGVTSVKYSGTVKFGEDAENDFNLRKRFSQAIEGTGSSNANAIRTAILRVPTVKSVSVIENKKDTTVAGRPPHSFECFVYGGEEYQTQIAQAIFDKAPIGISTCSTSNNPITVDIYDEGNTIHPITFSHTTNVPIYIEVSYKTNNKFKSEGPQQIKEALVEHINNLGVGSDVIYSSLYGYIYNIEGVKDVTDLKIGTTSESLSNNNISIENWEVALTDIEKIVLTEVI